jgi:uncharacterized protein
MVAEARAVPYNHAMAIDEEPMKRTISKSNDNLCEKCTGRCCRYFAFEIDKPRARRDFDDIRWFLLHEDTMIFVEEGDWYIQLNRKCKALMPDNRCGIYEQRPSICRAYRTNNCDLRDDDYGYDHTFTEPEQLAQYAKEYLARQRKRRAAARRRAQEKAKAERNRRARVRRAARRADRPGEPLTLLRSA